MQASKNSEPSFEKSVSATQRAMSASSIICQKEGNKSEAYITVLYRIKSIATTKMTAVLTKRKKAVKHIKM